MLNVQLLTALLPKTTAKLPRAALPHHLLGEVRGAPGLAAPLLRHRLRQREAAGGAAPAQLAAGQRGVGEARRQAPEAAGRGGGHEVAGSVQDEAHASLGAVYR